MMSHSIHWQKCIEPQLCARQFPSPWVQWLVKPESILLRRCKSVCEHLVVRGGVDIKYVIRVITVTIDALRNSRGSKWPSKENWNFKSDTLYKREVCGRLTEGSGKLFLKKITLKLRSKVSMCREARLLKGDGSRALVPGYGFWILI